MYPRHSHKLSIATLDLESSSSSSALTIASFESKRKVAKYLKLIDLYKSHEFLWNQCDPNFYNFELREATWENIARKMKPNSDPNKWKFLIHKLRYKVEREKIHEKKALFNNTANALGPKLAYSEKIQFLNHMFDRKRVAGICIQHAPMRKLETDFSGSLGSGGLTQESITAKCQRLGRAKSKSCPLYARKIKALESLRYNGSSNLIFTPDAFRKVTQLIGSFTTSGENSPYKQDT